MLSSSMAQAATNQWKRHTMFLLFILVAAHLVCFVMMSTQIDARHA
jgi:hypothetical protein